MNNREIKEIFVDGYGWVHSDSTTDRPDNSPIEPFMINGEMASIRWFRKGAQEFNGKYVVVINYKQLNRR